MSAHPEQIDLLHDGVVIASWSHIGEAMDGSGRVYLHRQFAYSNRGCRSEAVREVAVMCDESLAKLLYLPGIRISDATADS